MAIMLFLYFVSLAIATFIENDYGTPTAKVLIYEAKWFELLQLLLIINFIANIFVYKLYRRRKWSLLVFHLSFVLLYIGGAISRYISYEGSMSIRESEMSNKIVSQKTFFKLAVQKNGEVRQYKDLPYTMAKLPNWLSSFHNDFKANYDFLGDKITLRTIGFVANAKDSLRKTSSGKKILKIVSNNQNGRENIYLEEGKLKSIRGTLIGYNVNNLSAIQINEKEGKFTIQSPFEGDFMIMATQTKGNLPKDKPEELHFRSLYTFNTLNFVIPEFPEKAEIVYYSGDKKMDANLSDRVQMEVTYKNQKDTLTILGGKGNTDMNTRITMNGAEIILGYGAKIYETDFYLKLRDFQMERYPGSQTPSSYASEVSVIDNGKETSHRIFMNNVLDYKGYRFFQSSYDSDELGTILSVNHDFWGTLITYIGYFLMFIAMIATLFWKGTRFYKLNTLFSEITKSKKTFSFLLIFTTLFAFSQHNHTKENVKPIEPEAFAKSFDFNQEHTDKFGTLLVQSFDGRIKPVNTLALETLRKLTKKDNFYSLDANQWLLSSLITKPEILANVPLIKVGKDGGEALKKITQADENGYTTLVKLFHQNANGDYISVIENDYNNAFRKSPAQKTKFDKEVIEVNDRMQVLQQLLTYQTYRFIPIKNDVNDTWTSGISEEMKIKDTLAVAMITLYAQNVSDAMKTKNWSDANKNLQMIKDYQKKISPTLIPSDTKVFWEVFYNNINLFFKLMFVYIILGLLFYVNTFAKLLSEKKIFYYLEYFLLGILLIVAIIHGAGIALRWYITEHAPWSSGYEAVIFISWIGVISAFIINTKITFRSNVLVIFLAFLGFIVGNFFLKMSILDAAFLGISLFIVLRIIFSYIKIISERNYINAFIPIAGCFTAILLMGFAHGAVDLNPQISPLVPVLKSYWLNIHVAVITSSYGFFGLSASLAFNVLILYIIQHSKSMYQKIDTIINELTIISEMSLIIGIFLLSIGTFLGGIWANESWGRYWSWDPKETWAYISIMIYALVLHLRLIPKLQGKWLFNFLTLLAFSSVIMTYFGVNYYLSGLHSYATGDPLPIPLWIYIAITLVTSLGIASYIFYQKNKTLKLHLNEH